MATSAHSTTSTRRKALSDIMKLAWGLFRSEQDGPNPRTFADALAGAWRWTKNAAARVAPKWARRPGHVRFSSMVSSPIRRATSVQPYGRAVASQAGYMTSMVGR